MPKLIQTELIPQNSVYISW